MTAAAYYEATSDIDRFTSPPGWDFNIYSLSPKDFWYSKTFLPLSSHINITRYDFRSRVRFRAGQKSPGLQINFIDSYSTVNSRLQGMGKINSIVMITPPGYDWDGLSDVGALGIELNFGEALTNKIVSQEAYFCLGGLANVFGKSRSVVVSPTLAANRLRALAERFLSDFDQAESIVFNDPSAPDTHLVKAFDGGFGATPQINEDAMVEMARSVIDEIVHTPLGGDRTSSIARRNLALDVERLLWMDPATQERDEDISLEHLAWRFHTSKRTIQLALQEQFGLGFKALQRTVRLHQIRRALRLKQGRSVSQVASSYYVHQFGRFSQDYKQLFGVLPSDDLKRAS